MSSDVIDAVLPITVHINRKPRGIYLLRESRESACSRQQQQLPIAAESDSAALSFAGMAVDIGLDQLKRFRDIFQVLHVLFFHSPIPLPSPRTVARCCVRQ